MNKLPYFAGLFSIIAGVVMASWSGGIQEPAVATEQQKQEQSKAKIETPQSAETVQAEDKPLERARREMKLLDDMYKTAIVLITEHYVNTSDDLPAGEAFKLLFAAMQDKGWHEVRLIDASGEPLNDENAPAKGFEKLAIKELLGGKPVYDEVIVEKGKRYLRAATAIPVVMDKCVMCHDNYKDVPKGQAIGAVGYKIPIHDEEAEEKQETTSDK